MPEFRATAGNGKRTDDRNGTATERPERHNNHDDPAFSGLLEIAACEPTSPCSTETFRLGKKRALLSRLLRKSVQATKPGAVPAVAVAPPFQSTVQLPFPEKGASVTGILSPTLTPTRAASRKFLKNLFFSNHSNNTNSNRSYHRNRHGLTRTLRGYPRLSSVNIRGCFLKNSA